MSVTLFTYVLTILCVQPSEIKTNNCIDFMVNCVTIKKDFILKDNYEACEIKYKEIVK